MIKKLTKIGTIKIINALVLNLIFFITTGAQASALLYDGRELFDIPKSQPRDPHTLLGYWFGPDNMSGEVIESTRLKITERGLQLAVRCDGFFETEYVSVEVPIIITENTIEILHSDTHTKRNNDFICTASIEQTPPTRYIVINGHLHFDAFQDSFEKLRDL